MTSAEPRRKAPYAADLRWRMVWQRIGMELPYRTIAKNLNVALGTVYHINRLFLDTGDVLAKPAPQRRALRTLNHSDELFIIGLIIDSPSLYLSELCHAVEDVCGKCISPSAVCKVIHKHGFTRKKLQHAAKQRSLQYRGEYMAEIQMYHRDCFVFIDETGCSSRDHTRRFGYAMRGESAVDHRWLHRGTRISAIAAMSTSGILAVELMSGSVNGDKFFDYVRGSLIPEMLPFDGENPKSIAVLDNCSIHHVRHVIQLFKDAGILVLFLPPYSPDFMPIEKTFSFIKYYLKDHDDLWQSMNDPTILIQAAFDSVTSSQCYGWISSCGYP